MSRTWTCLVGLWARWFGCAARPSGEGVATLAGVAALVALAALTGVTAALPGAARAEYPEQPVAFVVPWPPGDLEDVLTRMIAEDFQAAHGVPAAVVNRPGGGGGPFPGAVSVATAPADGYTVGSFSTAVPVVGPRLGIPQLAPDTFEPLGIFLTYPFVIVTSADAPYDDMAGLAAHARDNAVVLGHYGAPLVPTQVTQALARALGFDFAADAAFDMLDCNTLASGDVDVMNTTLQLVMPCIDDITVLASMGGRRIPVTPDTPTVAELAPGLDIALWNGLFVHKDTPQAARDSLVAVARATVSSARAQALAAETGALVYWQDAATAADRIARDIETLDGIRRGLAD